MCAKVRSCFQFLEDKFTNLVHFVAQIFPSQTSFNGFIEILEDNVLLVELFDSRVPGAAAVSINDQLVKEGLATYEAG